MGSAILTYHSLDSGGSVISIRPEMFRAHIESLIERSVPITSLDSVLQTPRAVALTFDDGYENFAEAALPVLAQYRISATVFVVSGLCGESNVWCGARSGPIPRLRLMNWETIRSLPAELVSLGAHSVSHADLARLTPAEVESELRTSRIEIEQQTGRAVPFFAYPYGSVNKSVQAAAGREYELAVGTRLDHLTDNADPLNLPRIDAYYLKRPSEFRRQTAGEGKTYLGMRRWLRQVRRTLQ
jgi:peptidoglycan/xylan/chitin deacetylase (PgdA/CDA1 family)